MRCESRKGVNVEVRLRGCSPASAWRRSAWDTPGALQRFSLLFVVGALLVVVACGGDEGVGREGTKTAAVERAERRSFDGAPPVIPHEPFSAGCVSCHNSEGVAVPDVGFSPPSPHEETAGMSAISRCRQCHVFRQSDTLFVENTFVGLRQDLRTGRRLNLLAPPVIPHQVLMRENCAACHAGPAAREEILTSHPDRVRCRQCHLEQLTTGEFAASGP